MSMTDTAGITTVPQALVKGDTDLRISQRGLTEDKYRGSYERCAKIINRYSSRIGIDITEFYVRLVVCFIVGNSDMHLKLCPNG